jgi:anaerobic magnesium-protoporphyrin IX monomethyl ester cyclase
MDVLLTHSNHVFYDQKQVQKMQPYPPLQTLLAAAVLRQRGLDVGMCDVTLAIPERLVSETLRRSRPNWFVVCEDDFNFLTKMCLGRNRELAFKLGALARASGCRTAVHGSDASDHAVEYLNNGFDYVVLGEVEEALVELASEAPIESIAGLVYRFGPQGAVTFNRPRALRKDLDRLPSPAWDLIDMDAYRGAWTASHGYFSLNLVSSRGCPFRCNWCAKPVHGNSYHTRAARNVAEEMLLVKRRYRPDHIWFADDIFALSAHWTREFSKAVEDLDAHIPFRMQSRCDLMTRDTAKALKRAGCAEVWMGAESGSQRILDAMDKGIRVEQIHHARRHLAKNDIRVGLFLQFGYPGEGWDEIEQTIAMVRATQPDDIGVSVSYPLPGTKFHQLVSAQIGHKANWSESGDLAMMFRGAFSSDVYRALADALHLEVRDAQNRPAIEEAWSAVHQMRKSVATACGAAR